MTDAESSYIHKFEELSLTDSDFGNESDFDSNFDNENTSGSDFDSVNENDEHIQQTEQLLSSEKLHKFNIKKLPIEKALKLLELEPIEFRYSRCPDEQQFGLIADDVDEILPELVYYNIDGDTEAVHYERFDAYYIKIIQMMWVKIKTMEKEIDELKKK